MTYRFWLFLFCCICLATEVRSQEVSEESPMLDLPIYFSGVNPEHPIGIFSLDFPFYFSSEHSAANQFTFAYNMANTWHPKAWFVYPQNLTAQQQQLNRELYMTWRPTYFESVDAETKVKSFASDGVLQRFRMGWITRWKEKNSLIVNLNVHWLSGGSSPVHYFVSDRFIEWFHSSLAIDDNYGRRLYPFNKAVLEFEDEDSRVYRKEKGDVFTSLIDLHYYRELYRKRTPTLNYQFNMGGHLSLPLNDLHPYLIPGLSAGFRLDRLTTEKTSVTLAVDAAIAWQTFAKVKTPVKAIDKPFRESVKLYFGANVAVSDKSVLQLGILNNLQGELMRGGNTDFDRVDYPEIGIEYLYSGDSWEGEPISQEFWLAKNTPSALYYFSYKAFFVVGWQHRQHQFNFYVGEDFFFINNAPDFQLGFEYVIPLGGKK